jgi:hypothetical protein
LAPRQELWRFGRTGQAHRPASVNVTFNQD